MLVRVAIQTPLCYTHTYSQFFPMDAHMLVRVAVQTPHSANNDIETKRRYLGDLSETESTGPASAVLISIRWRRRFSVSWMVRCSPIRERNVRCPAPRPGKSHTGIAVGAPCAARSNAG